MARIYKRDALGRFAPSARKQRKQEKHAARVKWARANITVDHDPKKTLYVPNVGFRTQAVTKASGATARGKGVRGRIEARKRNKVMRAEMNRAIDRAKGRSS